MKDAILRMEQQNGLIPDNFALGDRRANPAPVAVEESFEGI